MSQENKTKEIIILSDCEGKSYKVGLELYKKYTKDEYFNSKDLDENDPRTIHPTYEKDINGKRFKIHFFDIQDRFWPGIANVCRHCDGALFAIDLDGDKDINKVKGETSTGETPKNETPSGETPKNETPGETPKNETPGETPKNETPGETPKNETPGEAPKETYGALKYDEEDSRIEFINEWLVNLDDLDKEDINKVIVGMTNSKNAFDVDDIWIQINTLADEKNIDSFKVNLSSSKNESEIAQAFQFLAKKIINDNVRENEKPTEDEELAEYLDIYKDF